MTRANSDFHVLEKKEKPKHYCDFSSISEGKHCDTFVMYVPDMWKPYLKVIIKAPQTLNILVRFHIMKKLSGAIDLVRRVEHQPSIKDRNGPVLKKAFGHCLILF